MVADVRFCTAPSLTIVPCIGRALAAGWSHVFARRVRGQVWVTWGELGLARAEDSLWGGNCGGWRPACFAGERQFFAIWNASSSHNPRRRVACKANVGEL